LHNKTTKSLITKDNYKGDERAKEKVKKIFTVNPNEIEGIYVRFKETDHYNWIGTHKYLAQRQHTQEVYCQQLVHNCSKITKCITCET
jgi:hypothetical protein